MQTRGTPNPSPNPKPRGRASSIGLESEEAVEGNDGLSVPVETVRSVEGVGAVADEVVTSVDEEASTSLTGSVTFSLQLGSPSVEGVRYIATTVSLIT